MKFFDLEMNGLAGNPRDVSYAEGINCANWKFTHGNNMSTCLAEKYKETSSHCGTNTAPIER